MQTRILCFLLTFLFTGSGTVLRTSARTTPSGGKTGVAGTTPAARGTIHREKDVVIYRDSLYYCAFPSVVKRPNGELLVAFRRAPNRTYFGNEGISHTDPNSYLVMVRSGNAETWTQDPELIYAHPFGGSQDPCLLQLKDGTLLCTSYAWGMIRSDADSLFKGKLSIHGERAHLPKYAFLGGYLMRSQDGGDTWKGPVYPPAFPSDLRLSVWGKPLPAYNRGALCEGKNGRIYWAVANEDSRSPSKTSNQLLYSDDKGITWQYGPAVAVDPKVSFNETSLYETPKGDLVAFLRTAGMDGNYSCISRSTDGGRSFSWQSLGFYGYPLHALRLPDERVLLTYGYRKKPYGIRGRVLNAECTDFDTAPDFIVREDGGSGDLGYCWSVMLDDSRVLVVYYFNDNDKLRYIEGTILKIAP